MNKFLAFLAVLFLACASSFAGEYPDISIAELKAAISSGKVTLVDANGSESWQKGHIPGAVDFEKSKDTLAKSLPKDKKALVVAYCGGPKCNAYQAAAKAAKKLGYKNVKHLSAGISGWKEAGEATQKGS
ncbi:MAG: rhodanese-like domain-containing protein [Verrucomicrobia bacterium]|nr:rhodanese-like domain-containing protein [Verrucomicrobiota bacterium]